MTYYVYVMASKPNGMIYVDIAMNLAKRVDDHKQNRISGFSRNYNVSILVYYEKLDNYVDAVKRSELFKAPNSRIWLISIIEKHNPMWDDLHIKLLESV
jgi:putative endonuclease